MATIDWKTRLMDKVSILQDENILEICLNIYVLNKAEPTLYAYIAKIVNFITCALNYNKMFKLCKYSLFNILIQLDVQIKKTF